MVSFIVFIKSHLSRGQVLQASDCNFVGGLNLVVIGRVGKSQRQKTLLLQVSFYK